MVTFARICTVLGSLVYSHTLEETQPYPQYFRRLVPVPFRTLAHSEVVLAWGTLVSAGQKESTAGPKSFVVEKIGEVEEAAWDPVNPQNWRKHF